MNVKELANTLGTIVIEALKNIRRKKIPLTATTLSNYLKENEDFITIFSSTDNCSFMQDLRLFLLDKITFFQSILYMPELNNLKNEIEKDEACSHIKSHVITLISILADYFDKAINIQGRLKDIIDEIIARFDKTSVKLSNILEENSRLIKSDLEEDKAIVSRLGDVNNKIINESSLEALKMMVISKMDELSREINKKIDNKNTVLDRLEKEKLTVSQELVEYKTKEHELVKLKKEVERYKMESVTDPLTGLYNRKFMTKKIQEEIERSKKRNTKFSVLFLDIDNFKTINDVYGHIVGDFVLKYLSRIIKAELRKMDYAFRYGGEEIVIVLSDADLSDAQKFAERLLGSVRNTVFKYKNENLKITISIGVTDYKDDASIEEIIERADMAMLKAKKEGKDRVVGA
jgi:diguanylate cyclase (GGDEF)-like protein